MMASRRLIAFGVALLMLLGAATYVLSLNRKEHLYPATLTLRGPVDPRQSSQDKIKLIPVFPTEKASAAVFRGNFWASPQLVRLSDQAPFLLLVGSTGSVAAIDLPQGKRLWQSELRQSAMDEVFARAAPAQFGDHVMIEYAVTDRKTGAVENRASVLSLRDGKISRDYPTLVFRADVPAMGGGRARFDSSLHLARAIAIIPSQGGAGRAYVTFSGTDETSGWHGWLFEVDLDRWRLGFANNAISAVFVATPEAHCDDGTNDEICGGGMWAYAGPQVQYGPTGPELLVQTGNGRLDLSRNNYAQALLRLTPGLKFNAQCDMQICADNPRNPAERCLATCKNLFVPRLLPSDPPLTVPDGTCSGKTYLECLELMDWDFGSSSPVRVQVAGHTYYVTTGKAGDVFLIDGEILGRMYDRKQAAAQCGTPAIRCPSPYAGTAITQPAATVVNRTPLVVIATYNVDSVHAAGAVAYRVVGAPQAPRLEEAWRFPEPSSPEARRWFRAPPTRPLITVINGEPIVWLAENGPDGHIFALRARDGKTMASVRTAGWPMRNALPVIYNDVLYLPAAVQGRENLTWIEAFRIALAN